MTKRHSHYNARNLDRKNQNADEMAHLAYFDQRTQLSIVWDGRKAKMQVCEGGYAEPVKTTIPSPFASTDLGRMGPLDDFGVVIDEFTFLCRQYCKKQSTFGE